MTAMYALFVVGVLVVSAVGLLFVATTPTKAAWLQSLLGRLGRIRDTCVDELGRYFGSLFVLLAGAAATFIICWPFGRIARRYKPNIDAPFLRWTKKHVSHTGSWHHINAVLTNMGNHKLNATICAVAAVVFAVLWIKRGWWIPPLIFGAAMTFEKFGQGALAKVVDRQKVPQIPNFGNYPSGGCARLIVEYGLIWFLLCLTYPAIGRRIRALGFVVVAVLAFVEGYTRVYLIKHWGMDVIGGWLFGTLLLMTLIGATYGLIGKRSAAPATAE
jgi:membrane-associated phospholipid phosphatase